MSYKYNSRRGPQMGLSTKLDQMIPLLEAIATSNTSAAIGTAFGSGLQPMPAMATPSQIAFATQPFDLSFATQPLMTSFALTSPPSQHRFKRFKRSSDSCDNLNNRKNRFGYNSYSHKFSDDYACNNRDNYRSDGQRKDRPKNFFGYKGGRPLVVTPEDEAKVEELKADGAVPHVESGQHGFKCSFCDKFVNSLTAALKHFESPKHIRARNLENLIGSDGKFVLKSDKMIDPTYALARNKEFNSLTKTQREEYCDQGIRLKDGIGSEAYFCVVCAIAFSSIGVVDQHIKDKKHLTSMAANKLGVPANECPVVSVEIDRDPLQSLKEKLQNFKEPVIGLDYISEYIDPDVNMQRIYECKLCGTWNPVATILTHLTGYPHRTNFIKVYYPEESHKFHKRTKESVNLCEQIAWRFEEENGRQKWKVSNEKPNIPENGVLANKFADSFQMGLNNKRRKALEEKGVNHLRQFISLFYELKLQENCRIADDNDIHNCVNIINTLTEVLLKHKLKQFPEQMRGLVAHKLMNKGIIDSFTNDYEISFDENACYLNSDSNSSFLVKTSHDNSKVIQLSDNRYSEEILEEEVETDTKEAETDIREVEDNTEVKVGLFSQANNGKDSSNQLSDGNST